MTFMDWVRVIAFMTFAKVFGLDEDDLPDPVRPKPGKRIEGAYTVLLQPGLRKEWNNIYGSKDDAT